MKVTAVEFDRPARTLSLRPHPHGRGPRRGRRGQPDERRRHPRDGRAGPGPAGGGAGPVRRRGHLAPHVPPAVQAGPHGRPAGGDGRDRHRPVGHRRQSRRSAPVPPAGGPGAPRGRGLRLLDAPGHESAGGGRAGSRLQGAGLPGLQDPLRDALDVRQRGRPDPGHGARDAQAGRRRLRHPGGRQQRLPARTRRSRSPASSSPTASGTSRSRSRPTTTMASPPSPPRSTSRSPPGSRSTSAGSSAT